MDNSTPHDLCQVAKCIPSTMHKNVAKRKVCNPRTAISPVINYNQDLSPTISVLVSLPKAWLKHCYDIVLIIFISIVPLNNKAIQRAQ